MESASSLIYRSKSNVIISLNVNESFNPKLKFDKWPINFRAEIKRAWLSLDFHIFFCSFVQSIVRWIFHRWVQVTRLRRNGKGNSARTELKWKYAEEQTFEIARNPFVKMNINCFKFWHTLGNEFFFIRQNRTQKGLFIWF